MLFLQPPSQAGIPPELREALRRCRSAFLGVGVFSAIANVLAPTGSLDMPQL